MKNTNYIYIYQNTFLNLLTLTEYLIKNKIKPLNIKDTSYEKNLLDEIVELDIVDNTSVINKISFYFGKPVLKVMAYLYLSNNENKELIIYYLFLNSIKYQKNILNMRNLKCVRESLRITKYVNHEAHKMKGFLRFKELENKVLYAEAEPTNNILELVSIHFKQRLKNEYWMICDKKRNIISIYDKKNYYIIPSNSLKIDLKMNIEEQKYEELWKSFYHTIGIKERKNEQCRRNFMPKKYWKYILEMEEKK